VSAQENEALVRRYFEEGWGKGNVGTVDEFMVPTTWSTKSLMGNCPAATASSS